MSVKEQKKVGMSETNSSDNFVKLFHYRSGGSDTNLKHLESTSRYIFSERLNKLIGWWQDLL